MVSFICTSNKGKLEEFKQALQGKKNICGLNDINLNANHQYVEPKENSDYFVCNASVKLFSALKFVAENYHAHECFSNINQVIVDDSGLCVPGLKYLPGVHSANFAGFPKDDKKNNDLLRQKIIERQKKEKYKNEKRLNAFFVCFLMSIKISNIDELKFMKNMDFSEAKKLLKNNDLQNKNIISLEKKLLGRVDLNISGGAFRESVVSNLLCNEFPSTVLVDVCYGFCCGEVSTQEQNKILGAGHGYDPLFYPSVSPSLSFASMPLSNKNNISHRAYAMKALNLMS